MSFQQELDLPYPIRNHRHEAVLGIVLTGALLAKEGDRLLRPMGLTDSQFNVLMLLRYQTEGGAISQTQLGRMLLVNRSNVTGLIDRMEESGWVRRIPESGDRRIKLVELTANGRRLLNRVQKVYFEAISRTMSDLTRQDLARLGQMLQLLRQRIYQEK